MGTDLKAGELQRRKEEILKKMAKNMEEWDGKAESGILLIDENETMIGELKVLNHELKRLEIQPEKPRLEEEKLRLISEGLEAVIREILHQKDEILAEKKKLKKNDDLESRYIEGRETPRFIDKKI